MGSNWLKTGFSKWESLQSFDIFQYLQRQVRNAEFGSGFVFHSFRWEVSARLHQCDGAAEGGHGLHIGITNHPLRPLRPSCCKAVI